MEITEIKISLVKNSRSHRNILAYVSCVFGGVLKVNDMKVCENIHGELWVDYPKRPFLGGKWEQSDFVQFVHPITKDLGRDISEKVLDAFKEEVLLNGGII